MDASTDPVATNSPSGEKHPALHGPLCEVTYTVSYVLGCGADELRSVSKSKSIPPSGSVPLLPSGYSETKILSEFHFIPVDSPPSAFNPIAIKLSKRSDGGQAC